MFLSQITDPDYESTREICIENKYKIDECIERIRAKERRISRARSRGKTKVLNVRRFDSTQDNEEIDPERYINQNGYYSFPKQKWNQLDDSTRAKVKKFNSELRKKRKELEKEVNLNSTNDEQPVTIRNMIAVKKEEDDNPTPTKKLRTVNFKDDDKNENEDTDQVRQVTNRRTETISFQVNEE